MLCFECIIASIIARGCWLTADATSYYCMYCSTCQCCRDGHNTWRHTAVPHHNPAQALLFCTQEPYNEKECKTKSEYADHCQHGKERKHAELSKACSHCHYPANVGHIYCQSSEKLNLMLFAPQIYPSQHYTESTTCVNAAKVYQFPLCP